LGFAHRNSVIDPTEPNHSRNVKGLPALPAASEKWPKSLAGKTFPPNFNQLFKLPSGKPTVCYMENH